MSNTLLRLPNVKIRSGLSRSTIYLRISQGLWPRPVSLGPRAVAWPEREVDAMLAALIAGNSEVQVRQLVHQLHADRHSLVAVRAG